MSFSCVQCLLLVLVTLYTTSIMSFTVKKNYRWNFMCILGLWHLILNSFPLNFQIHVYFDIKLTCVLSMKKFTPVLYESHSNRKEHSKNNNMLCKTHSLWPVVFCPYTCIVFVVIWYNVSQPCFAMKDIYVIYMINYVRMINVIWWSNYF